MNNIQNIPKEIFLKHLENLIFLFYFPLSFISLLIFEVIKIARGPRKYVNITVESHIQQIIIYNIQNIILSESIKYDCRRHSNWAERLSNSRKKEFEPLPLGFSKSLIFQLKIQTNALFAFY